MGINDLYFQFETAYKNAKLLVLLNKPQIAREYIIACMSIMREIYKSTNGVIERAKLYARICEFKNISASLFDSGVTADIKSWFGISTCDTSKKNTEANSTPIDKIIIDDTVDWAADVFAKYSKSVVIISAKSQGVLFSGTGFIISDKGYVLTNDHIVFDENRCEYFKKIIMRMQGDKKDVLLEVIDSDKKSDVAICRFDAKQVEETFAVTRVSDYSTVLPGLSVLVIGNGLSMGLAPFTGIVKFPHDKYGNLVTTVPSNHGDSGGPVFNRKGECIGINKSITVSVSRGMSTMDAQGITNATPMDKVGELLDKWCKHHNIEL